MQYSTVPGTSVPLLSYITLHMQSVQYLEHKEVLGLDEDAQGLQPGLVDIWLHHLWGGGGGGGRGGER